MPCKEKKKDKNMLRIFLYPSFFKSQHTVHYSIESWSNLSWTVIIILWKPWTAMGQTISSVLLQQCTEYSFSHNHKLFTSLSRNAFTSYHDKTKPCSYLLLKEINSALPACVHNILTIVATDFSCKCQIEECSLLISASERTFVLYVLFWHTMQTSTDVGSF